LVPDDPEMGQALRPYYLLLKAFMPTETEVLDQGFSFRRDELKISL